MSASCRSDWPSKTDQIGQCYTMHTHSNQDVSASGLGDVIMIYLGHLGLPRL
jgi:hypothetical protein